LRNKIRTNVKIFQKSGRDGYRTLKWAW